MDDLGLFLPLKSFYLNNFNHKQSREKSPVSPQVTCSTASDISLLASILVSATHASQLPALHPFVGLCESKSRISFIHKYFKMWLFQMS